MASADAEITDEQVEARGAKLASQHSAAQKWEKYTRWIHARVANAEMQDHPRQPELLALANRLKELAVFDCTLVAARLEANADEMETRGMLDDPALDNLLGRIEPTPGERHEVEEYTDEQRRAQDERTLRLTTIAQGFQEAEADYQQGMAQADADYAARSQERARNEELLERGMARSKPPAQPASCDTDEDPELDAIRNRRPSSAARPDSALRAQARAVPASPAQARSAPVFVKPRDGKR
jgi:hypothetical protein